MHFGKMLPWRASDIAPPWGLPRSAFSFLNSPRARWRGLLLSAIVRERGAR